VVVARGLLLSLSLVALAACNRGPKDEAQEAGIRDDTLVQADENYFRDMDDAVPLNADEVKGRNMWLVWTGGNDRFWDGMTKPTLGGFDLLKIVAPPPGSPNARPTRWKVMGLVNEPCFSTSSKRDRYGLWLDTRDPACPPDPFANAKKYPGVKIGARGTTVPVGSYFGEPSGILGLRLFPNPDFDEKAKAAWDADKYYNEPRYYNNPKLVRPYRVGMSCGFCHVGPSPTRPPADPEKPTYANLSSTVGAQYMWVDRLFMWKADPTNYMYQLVSTYRPGAMDTSLVSTDNINNPRTMNAIYLLRDRLEVGRGIGREKLAGGSRNNAQFNDILKSGPLTRYFEKPDTVWTPHVLKDGSDSVGALGALNRVYLNIGLFSEEWLRHFNPVVGGKIISPIEIETARSNSSYWRATEKGTPLTAMFFLKAARPDPLANAPGGAGYLKASPQVLQRGAKAFAETCARCHSSKQPQAPSNATLTDAIGTDYVARFQSWWRWTQTEDFKGRMRAIVARPDFRQGNYFSSDVRVPVTLLRTNLCSPLATNALRGNIWDNFSSESYKTLPSVGTVAYQDPFTGEAKPYRMPGGGRGYTRVPSLVSLWSTAPFLLGNTVGTFNGDPSVAGRMAAFDDGIAKMLWPERRERDAMVPGAWGTIDRTSARSYLYVPSAFLPDAPGPFDGEARKALKSLENAAGDIELGPIPKGMPVNLLASLQPLAESRDPAVIARHYRDLIVLLARLKKSLLTAPRGADDAALRQHFAPLRSQLMGLNKCPDFVVNRGHYFGTAQFNQHQFTRDERAYGTEPVLTDEDKRALVEYLKTL
jgi:hypothetical protein